MTTGCEESGQTQATGSHRRPLQVQAASSLQELVPTLIVEYEATHPEVEVNPRYAGSQTLARQIDAGAQVDVFLSADEEVVDTLTRVPTQRMRWISNELVVIAPADSDVVLDDLAMGDGPVALASEAVPLGSYTRLALRMKEIWHSVEARSTQFTSAAAVLQQVASGSFDLGVVYATDAALEPRRVRVVGALDLPESVDVVYLATAFSPEGEAFIAWLATPEAIALATKAGFTLPRAVESSTTPGPGS